MNLDGYISKVDNYLLAWTDGEMGLNDLADVVDLDEMRANEAPPSIAAAVVLDGNDMSELIPRTVANRAEEEGWL